MPKNKKFAEPVITTTVNVEKIEEYAINDWSGNDHFTCKLCTSFDTFDKTTMLNHLVNEHDSESALAELYGTNEPATEQPSTEVEERLFEKEIDNGTTNFDETNFVG